MNLKKLAGICVVIPVLLSGCGNQPAAQSASAAVSTAQPQQQSQSQTTDQKESNPNRPAMSQQQRQMFSTFQTLLKMDKADGLSITKEEAQAMLPTAQDIVAKGEITDDSKAKLLENLTDAQKKFVDDAAARMANRGNGKKNADAGNAAKSTDSSGNADASKAPSANQGQTKDQGPNGSKAQDGKGGGNRPAGEMKDPGKQLIELLQSKVS